MGPGMMQRYDNLYYIVVILLIAITALIIYMYQTREKTPKPTIPVTKQNNEPIEALVVAMKLLDENERKIVDLLVSSDGKMLQKDITIELEFTRVQTHRTLQSLIQRGVVTSEKEFNTNRIKLAKWLNGNN